MNSKICKYFYSSLIFILATGISAQVSEVEYGKNRIQYHDDFDQWLFYESENFITYWYGKARNHGVSTVKLAEQDHDEILDIIEHRINDKIQIIVYSDVSDLKQSNIGSEETFQTVNDQTKIEGSKVFVHFNGDHEELRRQIRKGVATVFLNSMFFGSNLQEIVQNSVSGAVPPWFQIGLTEYIGNFWNFENDDELRNIFQYERKTTFKKLSNIFPSIVGQSLWYYIGLTYGKSEISNLLYLTRINRSVEDAFLYVFGIPFEDITDQWESYFAKRYEQERSMFEDVGGQKIDFKRKKRVPITQVKYNPDGLRMAIVDNQISKTRVVIKDLESGESRKVFKHGYRNNVQATDYNYPQVAWLPDGSGLYIVYEYRDRITLQLIDFVQGQSMEQVLPERYERVYALAPLSEREIVFSALSQGMVDLFYFTTHNRQSTQLTQDIYDDLAVERATIGGVKGIVFTSNRPDDVQRSKSVDTLLPFTNFNVFHLAFEEGTPDPIIYQVTDNSSIDLEDPVIVGDDQIVFLTAENGILNRKMARVSRNLVPHKVLHYSDDRIKIVDAADFERPTDTLLARVSDTLLTEYQADVRPLTNYLHNIETFDINDQRGVVAEVFKIYDEYYLYEKDLESAAVAGTTSLHRRLLSQDRGMTEVEDLPPTRPQPPREEIIRSSDEDVKYLFQSRYPDMESDDAEDILEEASKDIVVPATLVENSRSESTDTQAINRLRIVPYRLKFKLHSLSTNMDNSLLFGGLDSYSAFKREYEPVPLGILIKADFRDLFEDYVFEGGIRIPTSFNGAEYFLIFDDKKNRLDRRYAIYRRTTTENSLLENNDPQRTRSTILLGQYGVRYPLDVYQSLRATATLRQDKTTILASDRNSLNNPDLDAQRAGIKLEYVFDNSLDIDLNIRSGIRFKVFTELVKKFAFDLDPLSLRLSQGFMTVVGTDARHYFNFAKHSVLATRVAAATSFGSEQILYYLGGIDNWLIPKFNEDTPSPTSGNFAYQTISPNLRGFDYNIRNGSTFALLNAEVRIPFFKYLSRRPIKISFFRHMQVVGFADLGAAWEGASPFDEDNPINIHELANPPTVRLRVNYYRDPLVIGYGVGVRTMLFGYFIRLDYAWGVETRLVQKPKLHLALGLDF